MIPSKGKDLFERLYQMSQVGEIWSIGEFKQEDFLKQLHEAAGYYREMGRGSPFTAHLAAVYTKIMTRMSSYDGDVISAIEFLGKRAQGAPEDRESRSTEERAWMHYQRAWAKAEEYRLSRTYHYIEPPALPRWISSLFGV